VANIRTNRKGRPFSVPEKPVLQLGGEILKVVPWEGGVKELLGSAKCKYMYKARDQ
jgi:hypothetical protein